MYFDIDKLKENKKEYKMTAAKRQYEMKEKSNVEAETFKLSS